MAFGAFWRLRLSINQIIKDARYTTFSSQLPPVSMSCSRTSRPRTFQTASHCCLKDRNGGTNRIDQSSLTSLIHVLPPQCPGCGGLTQTITPGSAGFYSPTRQAVKAFAARKAHDSIGNGHNKPGIHKHRSVAADPGLLNSFALEGNDASHCLWEVEGLKIAQETSRNAVAPVCNRCHDLVHHNTGVPIAHPTLEAVQDIIAETPHRYNHIYHILDAADFPLSLIPTLQRRLSLAPQRSINRRSQKVKYIEGRKADLSFIITRSDLLAPKKEQVDRLMPYLVQVLRDALGWMGHDVRLGNVRCVSAKRGWWTKTLKEEIWGRGGGGWMVGKVNVGKSNLLESILPKGRGLQETSGGEAASVLGATHPYNAARLDDPRHSMIDLSMGENLDQHNEEGPLLPPAPREVPFPVLPIVSELPGTTASPIRLPFGNGKGELIDLPGLARSELGDYVPDKYKNELVMRERVKPDQFVIKPGQSLLVGGIVRITARDPDVTLLAYPFVPLDSHVTSIEKATAIHTQTQTSGIQSLLVPGAGNCIASAGRYQLKWDVTQHRAGPLTAKAAVGLKPAVLPFTVYSVDILIEGCGWIELVAQVRKFRSVCEETPKEGHEPQSPYPEVDVHSPEGRFIGCRRPMEAWLRVGTKPTSVSKPGARPRPSMKGAKKTAKKLRQEQ